MQNDKQKIAQPVYEEQDENDIDGLLKKELSEKGLEYRFIDFKQAKENGLMSRRGWRIFKRESKDPNLLGFETLTDPDGLTRKGTMVLAVKPIALAQRQRDRIKVRRDVLNKYNKTVTDEVSQQAAKLGGSSRAIAGYEKNS
jgi:hypothetical protein